VHKTRKPVRKCHDCKLNLGDRCGVFENPHEQWKHGNCHGFGNDELCRQYAEEQAKHPPDEGKEKRRELAKEAKSETHHSGIRPHKSTPAGD